MGRVPKHRYNFEHRGKQYRMVAFHGTDEWIGYLENVEAISCRAKTIGALIRVCKEDLDIMYGDKHMAENFTLQVQGALHIIPEDGGKEFAVSTPFTYYNGESIVIAVRDEGERWILTDKGYTIKHLSQFYDCEADPYKKILHIACMMYGIENRDGELIREIKTINCVDPFYDFVQGLIRMNHVSQYVGQQEAINE